MIILLPFYDLKHKIALIRRQKYLYFLNDPNLNFK